MPSFYHICVILFLLILCGGLINYLFYPGQSDSRTRVHSPSHSGTGVDLPRTTGKDKVSNKESLGEAMLIALGNCMLQNENISVVAKTTKPSAAITIFKNCQ